MPCVQETLQLAVTLKIDEVTTATDTHAAVMAPMGENREKTIMRCLVSFLFSWTICLNNRFKSFGELFGSALV